MGKEFGRGATHLFQEQPSWYGHPGDRKSDAEIAAIPPADLAANPDLIYKVSPGFFPRVMGEAYDVYSTPYAPYTGDKLAPLTERQKIAHTLMAEERPEMDRAFESTLANLQASMGERSTTRAGSYIDSSLRPHTAADRQPWVDSTIKNVIRPMQDEMHRNLMRHTIPGINSKLSMSGRTLSRSRHHLHSQALADMYRDLNRESKLALFEGEKLGEEGMQKHKGRQIHAGEVIGGLASADLGRIVDSAKATEGMLGEEQKRKTLEAGALETSGKAEQAQEQAALDLQRAEFERQQAYPGEQMAAKLAAARGHIIPTNTQAMYPAKEASPSILSQLAGFGTGLMGMNMMRPNGVYRATGGSVRSEHYSGGRVKKLGGGSVLNNMMESMDPLNMVRQKLLAGANPGMGQMPMQQPQDDYDMQEQQAAPQQQQPQPSMNPIESGSQMATQSHAAQRMEHHRRKMDEYASRLEGNQAVNPMGSMLARAGFNFMGSKEPNFGARMGQALEGGLDSYENALKANASQEERANKMHEALLETYRIEETDRLKRDAEKEKADSLNKYQMDTLGEHTRHNKESEKIAWANVEDKGMGKGKAISVPVHIPSSNPEKPEGHIENIEVEPLTKERKERLKVLKNSWDANEEALNLSESMLKTVNDDSLGYTGPGGSHLNASAATLGGGYGDTSKHANFFKQSEALATAKAAALKGLRPNQFLERQIKKTKPEGSDTSSTIKENMVDHVDLFRRNNVEIISERKMLKKGVPEDVMDDALVAWRKDNRPSEDGELKVLKGTPLDYLPKAWKIALKSTKDNDDAEESTSEKPQQKAGPSKDEIYEEARKRGLVG